MGMYVDEMYGTNRFTSIEIFALDIASSEYADADVGYPKILRKINYALKKNWIEIVDSGFNGDFSKDKERPF